MTERSEDQSSLEREAAEAKAVAKEVTEAAHRILEEAQRRAEALVDDVHAGSRA
jgi:phenylpyruvate tautomerase PptA (4-oxalocrotonate tautomerase family)